MERTTPLATHAPGAPINRLLAMVNWYTHTLWRAFIVASAIYGAVFAFLCFASGLPWFSRMVIFDRDTVTDLKVGFLLILLIFLVVALLLQIVRWVSRYLDADPYRRHVFDLVFSMVLMGFGIFMLIMVMATSVSQESSPPIPVPVVKTGIPADEVLLRMYTPLKKASVDAPPGLYHARSLAGPARIQALGHGRYAIQMLPNR